ncbi:MAG TPA: peptidylprolyl isomerase [bacterium]|nr:peptidylprolyl isomerase [bacterium]
MYKRAITIFSTVAIMAMLALGCSNQGTKTEGAGEAQKPEGGTIIAEFDGGFVTAEEINVFLDTLSPSQKQRLLSPADKENFLRQVVESALLAKVAQNEGMKDDPAVQSLLNINMNGILASHYYQNKIVPKADEVQVTDEELKQYYDTNLSEFSEGQVKASHILVDTEEEANEIYAALKDSPEKFADIAKEKSKCPSGSNGGDLGTFGRGEMAPEFEKQAFSMEVGKVSEPFKTRFGWHILLVDKRSDVETTPFDEVKESIRTKLLDQKRMEVLENSVIGLKEQYNLKLYKELFYKVGEEKAPEVPGLPPAPPVPAEAE